MPSAQPRDTPAALNVAWAPIAPQTLNTLATGPAGGRILSVTADPSDATGNTVYLGTNGGVWKSTNAAGPAASVIFRPITDSVPAIGTVQGQLSVLSIGSVSVQPGRTGVVLAGTGDPTSQPDSMYGTGILRSSDGGNSWSVITASRDPGTGQSQNSFVGESVAGFAWSTTSPNLVVAAISSAQGAYAANAGYAYFSAMGLYYSQDAGQTWQLATISDGQYLGQPQLVEGPGYVGGGAAAVALVWNPVRRIFVAAVRGHGFYQSADGITWTRLASQPGTALSKSACPTGSGGGGSDSCPLYNAALAVQPGTGDMFAIATSQSDADSGLWQDVCAASGGSCSTPAPTFASPIGNAALETGSGTIAGASHALWLQAIPVAGDTLLYAGTQDLFRCSLAAGCVWRNATHVTSCAAAHVGAMQHAAAWIAGTMTFFFADDRGLWRSLDGMNQQQPDCSADDATHFDNLNATLGPLVEVTSLAQDSTDENVLLAGTGSLGTVGGSNGLWQSLLSTSGGGTAVGSGATAGIWFATSGAGVSIGSCPLGAQCGPGDFGAQPAIGNAQVSGDGTVLAAPAVWMLDPQDPSRMIVGTCRVWRGLADGTNWGAANALSGMLGGSPAPACQSSNTQVRSIAATGTLSGSGSAATERLYAGMAGFPDGAMTAAGHVWTALVTPASTTTKWTDLSGNPVTNDQSDAYTFNRARIGVSAIAVDRTDTTGATLYVGVSGYGGEGFAETANVPLVYASTDTGQHWANITNGLPNAPVNAILVDPEDPAIVYVGTDVGVFVTTEITQCADPRQSCWSIYGAGLPAVKVTSLAAFDAGGVKWLRIGTQGRGVWQTELASVAIQQASAGMATISPATLNFPSQAVGTVSASQPVTLQNTGQVALMVGALSVSSSDFNASSQCPSALPAGAACTLSIAFAPTATGPRSATLTVAANVPGGVLTSALAGIGAPGGVMVLTPLRLDFGELLIGSTSPVEYLTIANTGTGSSTLQTPTISGPFRMTANTCGAALPPNTSCTVGIVFTPTASGLASGSLVTTGGGSTQTALLSGTGQTGPSDTLNTVRLSFASQPLGTTSAAQQVTLTNTGDSALNGIAARVTGDFAVVNLCGASLPAHSTCAMQVTFVPQAVGAESGQLIVQDFLQQQTVVLRRHGRGAGHRAARLSRGR